MPGQDDVIERAAQVLSEADLVELLADEAKLATVREALAAVAKPDVEVEMFGGGGTIGPFTGPDALERAWREWVAAFASYRVEADPDVRRSANSLVVFARQVATPRGTQTPVTSDGAIAVLFDGGKMARIEFHLDREAALRSAGLAG